MEPAPPELLPPVKIGNFNVDIAKLLKINPSNMQTEFEMVAGWIGTISYHYSLAKLKVERQERQIKALEADKSRTARSRMVATLAAAAAEAKKKVAGKPTEAQIKQEWINDPEIRAAYDKLDQTLIYLASLEAARQGLNTKRDMLVNLGAELRRDRRQ